MRVVRHLPRVPVGIDEHPGVPAPERLRRLLADPGARSPRLLDDGVHFSAPTRVVGERHTAIPAAVLDRKSLLGPSADGFVLPTGSSVVLVIDDDPTVHDLMRRMLAREGIRVESALDGESGLKRARELHPSAITLDVMMPGMDGWSVLSAIKADPVLADIPVVMVTIVDDRNLGFAMGAAEYLVKPVDLDALQETLAAPR